MPTADPSSSSSSNVKITVKLGYGFQMVPSKVVKKGIENLRLSPLLIFPGELISEFPILSKLCMKSSLNSTCSGCLRSLNPCLLKTCSGCRQIHYCSRECQVNYQCLLSSSFRNLTGVYIDTNVAGLI